MEKDLAEAIKKYDFIRFTYADIHGIARCKTIPKSSFSTSFNSGAGFYAGAIGFGFRGELEAANAVCETQEAAKYRVNANVSALPVPGTLHPVPYSGSGKYRVGEIFCETFHCATWMRQEELPRWIARKQLDLLRARGFELFSGVEIEFHLIDIKTEEPIFHNIGEMFSTYNQNKVDELMMEIVSAMEQMGVEVATVHSEYCEGQYELTLKPQLGIKAADNHFIAKDCIKEVARKHDLRAVFMTKINGVDHCNGTHFNHCLKLVSRDDDVSAFHDGSGVDNLSHTFRHWMGGLVRHFRALNAICSPTVTCYRRLDHEWAPCASTWSIDDRMDAYRVKNYSPSDTYIENRLPSGSSNTYLIMAATIAAGLDGYDNNLDCPPPNPPPKTVEKCYRDMDKVKVPKNLEEALVSLEDDKYMVESLGPDFIKWFIILKRQEIQILAGCDVKKNNHEDLSREQNLYMDML